MSKHLAKALVCTLIGLSASAATADEDLFPRPDTLKPAIAFWTSVYSEADTNSGYIHDSRNLSVIYEKIDVSGDWRQRRRAIRQATTRYREILQLLASGERGGLTTEEARVLALWPADVSNDELRSAAQRLRFQLGQADRFQAGLIRSGRWSDHIATAMEQSELPPELAILPHVESSFDPTAYSKVGAAGMWQFTRSTGALYMRIDQIVDERRDPYLSTFAAAELLKFNYSTIQSWPLALTAYNHGLSGMQRAVRQLGTRDIGVVVDRYRSRSFGFASRNFYAAFLAALDVDTNAEAYFGPLALDEPIEYTEFETPDFMDATTVARALDVELSELRRYNPALMEIVWAGDKYVPRGFELRLPSSSVGDVAALFAAVPAGQRFAAQRPDEHHRVRRGETLSQIARQYRVSTASLVRANNLRSSHFIRAGQLLTLPVAASASASRQAEAPVAQTARPISARPAADTAASANESAAPANALDAISGAFRSVQATLNMDVRNYSVAGNGSIEVQEFETLGHYADWLEVRTQRLRDVNGLPFNRPVSFGQRIELDFSNIDREEFERRRIAFQRQNQQSFLQNYQIADIQDHVVSAGESLWVLTQRTYRVPVWLLRQYNPGLDFDSLSPGTVVRFPRLRPIDSI